MTNTLKILAAQLNPIVGDINGNLEQARRTLKEGAEQGADLVVFPEMFLLGYPPEDLVLKPSAVEDCMAAIETLAKESTALPAFVIGSPWQDAGLYNSVAYCADGAVKARYDKQELPNYGVFDEQRLFKKGKQPACIVELKGVKIALAICEDVWFRRVPVAAKSAGADVLVIPNGSPWRRSIHAERAEAFDRWSELDLPYLFVNQVGGQDELVFDGGSYATNSTHGERCGLVGQFEVGTQLVEFDVDARKFVLGDRGCRPITGELWQHLGQQSQPSQHVQVFTHRVLDAVMLHFNHDAFTVSHFCGVHLTDRCRRYRLVIE